MDTYSFLREFADSWHMLFMLAFFVGLIAWVLLGNSKSYRDTAESIFRHDEAPAAENGTNGLGAARSGKEARQ